MIIRLWKQAGTFTKTFYCMYLDLHINWNINNNSSIKNKDDLDMKQAKHPISIFVIKMLIKAQMKSILESTMR